MGTSNFKSMTNFNIYAWIYEPDIEFIKDEYPESIDDNGNVDCNLLNDFAISEWEWVESEITPKIDDMNDSLIFHKIRLESGYYDGVQIFIEEPYGITAHSWDKVARSWTLEECISECWYDKFGDDSHNKNRLISKYLNEVETIQNWLDKVGRECGFIPYGSVARFGNGETWYQIL